ncbi:LacI family DNA-binding transcriptional regulator, partial [Nocardioides sp.]|uniref:LacI family DNA-binding transcriptional regulator n=1 Tax=Nocardioides sp. TaxID=35761 RepID=UPI00286E6742
MDGTKKDARPGTPTLDEVARVAGVSRATASRAINGGQRVSARAQSSVDAAVSSLGYVPNPAARSLVTRRTDSIAVVVPEPDDRVFSDPFFAGTLRGVTRVLGERDIQLVLLLARPGASTARTLRYLTNRHVDGALVVSHHRDDGLAEHMARLDLPCVFGGRPWAASDRVAYVDVDNTAGERLATEVDALASAKTTLFRIRFALHVLARRAEERLLFDYQRELARILGYRDKHADNLGVEQCMQEYYRAARCIAGTNEELLARCSEMLAPSVAVGQKLGGGF